MSASACRRSAPRLNHRHADFQSRGTLSCVTRHGVELDTAGLVHRTIGAEVLERFLDCGDLHKGFARVYCDQRGHDYLLAYSCKTRYFCLSCH